MSTELKMESANQKDWRVLEFFVPIEEAVTENQDFMIRGVAINETTTLNNVKYVAEELEKAASSFRNVPILLDHRNEVRSIVGRTTENVMFNPSQRRIDFEAKIMDKDIREMIRDGRIGSVSIGAKVQDLTEEDDGSVKAVGIHGLEISLVAVPGDSHANLAQALQQGFHLKEKLKAVEELDDELNNEENVMAEEETQTQEEEKEEVVVASEEKEEVKEEPKEEKEEVAAESVSEMKLLKEQIAELKVLLIEKKKVKEKMEEEKE